VFTETIFISTHPHYLLTCHPERGRFLADEGPAVRLACPFSFSLSLRCHPERGRFLADEGPAVRFASFLVLLRSLASPAFTPAIAKQKFAPPSPPT
jgi:hypothetical protein